MDEFQVAQLAMQLFASHVVVNGPGAHLKPAHRVKALKDCVDTAIELLNVCAEALTAPEPEEPKKEAAKPTEPAYKKPGTWEDAEAE